MLLAARGPVWAEQNGPAEGNFGEYEQAASFARKWKAEAATAALPDPLL
jgi:hypothetical protein